MVHKLFVYGTLKRGSRSNSHGMKFLKEDSISGDMYNVGYFPAVILGGQCKVYGELFEVDEDRLKSLDMYEGYHGNPETDLYTRTEITTDSGERCLVYVFNRSVDGLKKIEEGVWRS